VDKEKRQSVTRAPTHKLGSGSEESLTLRENDYTYVYMCVYVCVYICIYISMENKFTYNFG
jgi:hypothetical protein